MNFAEYQEKCQRTVNEELQYWKISSGDIESATKRDFTMMAAAGLCGEMAEAIETIYQIPSDRGIKEVPELVKDEFGDVLWYLAMVAKASDTHMVLFSEFNEVYSNSMLWVLDQQKLLRYACKIMERAKKFRYHNKELDTKRIAFALKMIWNELNWVFGSDKIKEMFEYNIAKLEKRYPDGFKKG